MLKGVPSILTADLLWLLSSMGHGDELALVDRNFPAASVAADTVTGKLVELSGVDTTEAAEAIFKLFPLDSFVEAPLRFMEPVDQPGTELEVHRAMQAAADAAEGEAVTMRAIERHAFYAAARESYGVVRTTEARPYGCFLLKKGVIFD